MDLFASIAPESMLTRDMLPDSPAVEYPFDVAERFGAEPGMSVATMLTVCAAAIHDDIKLRRSPATWSVRTRISRWLTTAEAVNRRR